jgi:hypothetical protein
VALAPKGKRDIAAMAGDKLEDILPANEPENRGRVLAEQAKAQRLAQLAGKEKPVKTAPEPKTVPTPKPVSKPVAKPPASVEDFALNGDDLEIAPGIRWNKKISWKLRVKQALQYRTQPEVLALIRAYEVPMVVKQIDAAIGKQP